MQQVVRGWQKLNTISCEETCKPISDPLCMMLIFDIMIGHFAVETLVFGYAGIHRNPSLMK
jgi:hypothetical protein